MSVRAVSIKITNKKVKGSNIAAEFKGIEYIKRRGLDEAVFHSFLSQCYVVVSPYTWNARFIQG